MKRKIFIGSSTESGKTAFLVKKCMEPDYECIVWDEGFFEMNSNIYHNLIKKSIAFDYAIFVGGPDDFVVRKSTGEDKNAPRDNVYFELGLYAGILSPERSFFLVHKNCKVASDLFGISLMFYEKDEEIKKHCKNLKKQISAEEKLGRITLLPSTSLAYGYYDNFVRGVCRAIENAEEISIEGKVYGLDSIKEKRVDIVFPNTVIEDWKDWTILYQKKHNLKKAVLKCEPRDFSVYIDEKSLVNGKLRVIDVPHTLRSSFYCVEQIAAKNYTGEKQISRLAKQREVRNFKRTLKNLIAKDSYAKKYIKKFIG